jgi:hypothetical protein
LHDVPANVTQNHKGTISRTIDKEIGGRIATARIHTNMHLAEQRKHKAICEAVRVWEAEQAEQESYFDDEQGVVQEIEDTTEQASEEAPAIEVLPTETETPILLTTEALPETPVLPTVPSTQKVENPIFQKVVDQNAKVIPTGNLQAFTSDFGLPEDDGVAEPKTPKNTGGQPSPFPNPTDTSAQVVTPNSNTAQFATNIAKTFCLWRLCH